MPHGMKIGIGTGHTVLDGDPAPAERDSAPAPHFSPMSVVGKGLNGSKCHWVQR